MDTLLDLRVHDEHNGFFQNLQWPCKHRKFFLPRGIADGLTVIGIFVMVYAFMASQGRTKQPSVVPISPPAEPPSSRSETQLLNQADTELQGLTWAQATGLYIIYTHPHRHLRELTSALDNLGFADVVEKIVDPLKRSTLVQYDMQNIRIGPSHQPIIARHVESWARSLSRL